MTSEGYFLNIDFSMFGHYYEPLAEKIRLGELSTLLS